ncbi:MAG: nuclear transport factor 2 family protein [Candidatus Limnocylindria bacterium]
MGEDQPKTRQFEELLRAGDLGGASAAMWENATDDFVKEWPQSGEIIRGVENDRAIAEHYPARSGGGGAPAYTFRRVLGSGDLRVVLGEIDYGDGVPVQAISIAELRDGKIARVTEFFASPFEAPEWRRQWVELGERTATAP